ncbi:hypothetical protein DL768_010081 [Monosporascus sp. mg162]|nr:hypothetical protein DL768_010081 [Monosporascus sp. mg162]
MSAIRYAPDVDGKGYSPEEAAVSAALDPRDGGGDQGGFSGGHSLLRRQAPPGTKAPHIRAATVLRPRDLGRVPKLRDRRRLLLLPPLMPRPIFDSEEAASTTASGSPLAALEERLEDLRVAVSGHAVVVALEGQGYPVNNHRFLHERMAYSGPREILRILAHPDGGDAECK